MRRSVLADILWINFLKHSSILFSSSFCSNSLFFFRKISLRVYYCLNKLSPSFNHMSIHVFVKFQWMILNKNCALIILTNRFDEENIIPKLLNQYMKSSVWKEILEIDFRSLKTYQSFLWLLDASKAPGDQHCFMEQCQSKENNQKIYIYNENLWRWCPKMCQEM